MWHVVMKITPLQACGTPHSDQSIRERVSGIAAPTPRSRGLCAMVISPFEEVDVSVIITCHA